MYYVRKHREMSAGEKRKEFIGYWIKKLIGLIAVSLCFFVLYIVFRYNDIKITGSEVIIGLPIALFLMWMFTGH